MKKHLQKNHTKLAIIKTVILAIAVTLFPFVGMTQANASPIMGRSVLLSTSVGNASGVTYTLTTSALPTTGTAVKSVGIQFCTLLTGGCITPAGFSSTLSSLASQPTGLGAASGWTVSTATTGSLRILDSSNATNPTGAVSITWNGVNNPTATNTTFYGIITTYSDAAWTTPLDTGNVALSTSAQIQVALSVNETLTFCTGTSITGQNCGTAAGSQVNLGVASTSSTSTGTSILAASTNGSTGYSIAVSGTTLMSGTNPITALASGGASATGSKQFGLNLASNNTTPVVGAAETGSGTAAASTNYGTNNTFRFASGDPIASVGVPTNANTFTVGYIANIDGLTPAGVYTSNLTYTATANF
ncbi:MAG TPA: hypothetical protein VMR16_03855 [Candidatus Saccharimonadales bacterium]|nr:hypothetical protein [Candidatus Saccharimonadales bacterium]